MIKENQIIKLDSINFHYEDGLLLCDKKDIKFSDNLLKLLLLSINNNKIIAFKNIEINNADEEKLKKWTKKNNIEITVLNKQKEEVERLIIYKNNK
ncbi:MAG: hypothetical protein PHO63_06220 [Bacilli bacterium]|nr:hypothetical protein [Bacilli bacterium]